MISRKWIIEKYETAEGRILFDEWFESLSEDLQARVDARLDRVSLGNFGDWKAVGGGVEEFRFFFGPGYRVYFGRASGQVVLLLCGGDKSTQKKDVKRAQMLWREFLREESEEQEDA